MTLIKDTQDEWLPGLVDYVRDQLRANTTVGLSTTNGLQSVEYGQAVYDDLVAHPDASPSVRIELGSTDIEKRGNVYDHRTPVLVSVHTVANLENLSTFADAQRAHLVLASRVYNETLYLHDAGITAGHWHDWQPITQDRSNAQGPGTDIVLTTIHNFEATRSVIMHSGGN